MKYVARAVLAVLLLVGFYVIALGLVVAIVVGLVEVFRLGFKGLLWANLFALAVPVVIAALYGVFGGSRTQQPPSLLLTDAAEPRLWATARELAELARTRGPDELRLVADANAAVSDTGSWLGLRRGTRRLYLGVPLLIGLDEAQLRSVLAHELGHYSGRHTSLAGISYRGSEAIRRTVQRLGHRHVASRLFRLYARLYFAVSHSVNRRQELEADRLSARAAGPEVAASALLELAPLTMAWQHYVAVFAGLGRGVGRRPAGLLAGFAHHLAEPEVIDAMRRLREAPGEEKTSVFDTHPSTGQRVAALVGTAPVERRRDGSAIGLLTEPERALASLEETLYAESEATPTALPELAPLAGADQMARRAAAFDRVLMEQGRNPGIGTVYHALGNGTAARLLRQLAPDEDLDPPKVMATLLADYLGAALNAAGQARLELDWATGWTVVDRTGAPLELVGLVEEVLAQPSLAVDLRELMRLSGVSDAWRPAVPAEGAPAGPSRVRGLLSPVSSAKTLVVTDTGLLWLTQTWRDRFAIASRMTGREADPLFERYAAMTAEELARTRRSREIPWSAIAELRVVPRSRGRALLLVAVAGGQPLVVKVQKNTQEAGQPWAALAHHLDARFVAQLRMPAWA